MPARVQGIASKVILSRLSLEELVVGGIGVLLFFVGLWVTSIGSKLFCFAIATVALGYVIYSLGVFRRVNRTGSLRDTSVATGSSERRSSLLEAEAASHHQTERPFVDTLSEEEQLNPVVEEGPHLVSHREPAPAARLPLAFSVSDYVDLDPGSGNGIEEPTAEFGFSLERLLAIMKEVLFAHTVSFFWVKRETNQIVLEAKNSDSDAFMVERKLPIKVDLVSRVAVTGRPEVISRIDPNAERDIVPYYSALQNVRSFVAVPVYYPKVEGAPLPIGVLAADSLAEDAYGEETLRLLGKFTKVLSSVLKTSTDKYDLLVSEELLKANGRLQKTLGGSTSVPQVVNTLVEEVSKLLPWDAIAVTLFDPEKKQWVVASVRTRVNERYVVAKQTIDFHKSIVGNAIRRNSIQSLGDLSKSTMVRFLDGELSMGVPAVGSFVAVPIASATKCYGAVTFESGERNAFGPREAEMVVHLATTAAAAIELCEANEIIHDYVAVDDTTSVATKKYFNERLEQELIRADDEGADLSCVLMSITPMGDVMSRYGKSGADAALQRVAALLQSSVRPYDIVGRYDEATFGLVLPRTTANDAYLWAEKVRSAIASSVISFDQKTFSVMVTAGICGATDGMRSTECTANAEQVLRKAVEAGGNCVRVF